MAGRLAFGVGPATVTRRTSSVGLMPSREPLWLANPSYRPFRDRETRRTGSGFQAAMVRAHSRAAALSVMAGNSRRNSTAADNSPP
jgi:hypothetical protein